MITRRGIIGAIALTGIAGIVGPRWASAHDARVRDTHAWPRVNKAALIEPDTEHPWTLVGGDLFGIEAGIARATDEHAYFRVPMRGVITQVFVAGTLLPGPGGDVQTIRDLMLARVDEGDFVACGRLGCLKTVGQYRSLNVMVNGRGIARAT